MKNYIATLFIWCILSMSASAANETVKLEVSSDTVDKLILIIEKQIDNSHKETLELIKINGELTAKLAEQAKESCKKRSLREKLFGK